MGERPNPEPLQEEDQEITKPLVYPPGYSSEFEKGEGRELEELNSSDIGDDDVCTIVTSYNKDGQEQFNRIRLYRSPGSNELMIATAAEDFNDPMPLITVFKGWNPVQIESVPPDTLITKVGQTFDYPRKQFLKSGIQESEIVKKIRIESKKSTAWK